MKKHWRFITTNLLCSLLVGVTIVETITETRVEALPSKLTDSLAITPKQNMRYSEKRPQLDLDNQLIEASNRFGFKLFGRIANQEIDKNIFISPLSVSLALSMTYNGANGETKAEIAKLLEAQDIEIRKVNTFNQKLQSSLLNIGKGTEIAIANSLWANEDVSLKQSFVDITRNYYQAEIRNLNFDSPDAVKRINAWVKQKTKDKINSIVNSTSNDTVMILVNAIYFKSAWSKPFKKSNTTPKPFILENGQEIQHPAMSQSDLYRYLETPQFQAVRIPYGKGGSSRLSMDIFLPKTTSNLKDFQRQLTAENWQNWSKNFSRKQGLIQVPKFKFEYGIDLVSTLKAMGMQVAFSPKADFSNLSSTQALIDEVKHKTFVDVNEEGTEAAAVTAVVLTRASNVPEPDSFQMIINRPFFFAISDRQTGTILFMGIIKNPSLK